MRLPGLVGGTAANGGRGIITTMPLAFIKLIRKRYALFALLLWAQLVFGMSMTLWRHSLVLFSGWAVYPPYVESQFDDFIKLAADTCPPEATMIYLAPGSSEHTARFARLHYFLYPHSVVWWSPNPALTPLDRWQQVDVNEEDIDARIEGMGTACLLVEDLPAPILRQKGLQIDARRHLYIFDP
jgi:hypothetical protein